MQNPRCYEPHFQKSLILLDPTWIIPGPQSLIQLFTNSATHQKHLGRCINSQCPGTIIWLSNQSMWAQRSENKSILGHPGDAGKVWELAPQGTALLLLTPCCGRRTVKQLASWLQEEHCHVSLSVLDEQTEQWMEKKKKKDSWTEELTCYRFSLNKKSTSKMLTGDHILTSNYTL